jgi:hypothetical protein
MHAINDTRRWSGKPVDPQAITPQGDHIVGFCSIEHRDQNVESIVHFAQSVSPIVTMRSFDLARTGPNVRQAILISDTVRNCGIMRLLSLNLPAYAPLRAAARVFNGSQLGQHTLGRPINRKQDDDRLFRRPIVEASHLSISVVKLR